MHIMRSERRMKVWCLISQVKKLIMKSLKGHVMEVAKSEHGHLILLALFDTVDDTVLLKKVSMNCRKCRVIICTN
jgi:hypothetical protein